MSGRSRAITSRPASQPSASPTTWTQSAVESIASSPRRDSSWSSMRTTRLVSGPSSLGNGTLIRTVVPSPGALATSTRPPNQPAWRAMPLSPMPSSVPPRAAPGSNPTPSSPIVMMAVPRKADSAIRMEAGRPCTTALRIASAAMANSLASSQPSARGREPVTLASMPARNPVPHVGLERVRDPELLEAGRDERVEHAPGVGDGRHEARVGRLDVGRGLLRAVARQLGLGRLQETVRRHHPLGRGVVQLVRDAGPVGLGVAERLAWRCRRRATPPAPGSVARWSPPRSAAGTPRRSRSSGRARPWRSRGAGPPRRRGPGRSRRRSRRLGRPERVEQRQLTLRRRVAAGTAHPRLRRGTRSATRRTGTRGGSRSAGPRRSAP